MATIDRHPTKESYGSEDKDGISPRLAVHDLPHDEELSRHVKQEIDDGFDPAMLRKLTRKIDWRLVPYLAACYSVSLIDRTNIALARSVVTLLLQLEEVFRPTSLTSNLFIYLERQE
jgi:hypothetical protein